MNGTIARQIVFSLATVMATTIVATTGCALREKSLHEGEALKHKDELDYYHAVATKIEYPDLESCVDPAVYATEAPITIEDEQPPEYWDVTLEEAIHTALANSQVLRQLGAAVLRTPEIMQTAVDPAIVQTDPRFGVAAALSAFDATFSANASFEEGDQFLNDPFFGGGGMTRFLTEDEFLFRSQIAKRSATGTQFAVRKNLRHLANNVDTNLFPSFWTADIEVEARHPLLQGSGVQYNRIYGPNGGPGVPTGVLIARINTDTELAEFEVAVRNLVSNVENAYWDLYFAYRDLDARVAARDAALETWRRVHALFEANRRGGEAEKEAQAREQYFRFQVEVENALTGRLLQGTQTNNGSSGGTFRGTGGIHVTQRRLRLMMGIPSSDGRLIRPADEPTLAKVLFDWTEVAGEALARRTELRRQRWQVKRRELELIASRNFLLPQLDTVAEYRWRGFGEQYWDAGTSKKPPLDNAMMNLVNGDFQEWQLGLELSMPIGFRQGHAAVRNAQLQLARQRALLQEQEHQVMYDLSNAIADMDRAFKVSQTAYNRRVAARQQLSAVQAAYDADKTPLDQVLNAQRRVADSESRYHRLMVEYALAVKNVHFEKGSLLDYSDVHLAEGPWPSKAYHDAAQLNRRRSKPHKLNYVLNHAATIVSLGDAGGAGPVHHGDVYESVVDDSQIQQPEEITPPPSVEPENQPMLPPPADNDLPGGNAGDTGDMSSKAVTPGGLTLPSGIMPAPPGERGRVINSLRQRVSDNRAAPTPDDPRFGSSVLTRSQSGQGAASLSIDVESGGVNSLRRASQEPGEMPSDASASQLLPPQLQNADAATAARPSSIFKKRLKLRR